MAGTSFSSIHRNNLFLGSFAIDSVQSCHCLYILQATLIYDCCHSAIDHITCVYTRLLLTIFRLIIVAVIVDIPVIIALHWPA